MKKTGLWIFLSIAAICAVSAQTVRFSTGDAKLDASLNELNASAKLDINGFYAEVSLQWGVARIELQVQAAALQPAELYLAAALAKLSGKSFGFVVETYKKNKAKGWGALARELGIKPGSKAFKDLKARVDTSKGKFKK
ncbi:MAG: hypothetical protein E4H20_07920 [Spirochaetales bacterium]|nr:MAG: hypothetical protein E4H20_07920 [Spirochaetales bacterium]